MKEHIKKMYSHKWLRVSVGILSVLFILGATFELGVFVGYHKASFARDWGDHYKKNFGMERPESFRGMMRGGLPMSHGSVGKVLTVTLPQIVIADKDGTEKNIIINEKTVIKNGMQNASSSSITPESNIMVIGEPNTQGQIEAKFIRIVPSDFGTSTSPRQGMMRNNMMYR